MSKGKFFALVGATGAGKSEIHNLLKGLLSNESIFLCDSNGCGDETHPPIRFTKRVTQLAQQGVHKDTAADAQLLLFWSRLTTIIQQNVQPSLKEGKNVIMNGFGGTILANALCSAKEQSEKDRLVQLHMDLVRHCVLGKDVPPPVYIWLKVCPEVAYQRLRDLGKLPRIIDSHSYIEEMNRNFEFYRTLPHQKVITIDANQPLFAVLDKVLEVLTLFGVSPLMSKKIA